MPRQRVSSRPSGHAAGAVALDLLLVAAAAGTAFAPLVRNGFVNWDDPAVLVDNVRLRDTGVAAWAFSTTLIGHFQPLAWLGWALMARVFGISPGAFHAASLAMHAVNAALVYVVAWQAAARTRANGATVRLAALGSSVLFLLHPTVVEPVAWASAFPYVASLTPLLCATLAYLAGRRTVALACYALSVLTRPIALGFPLVLLGLDLYPLRRDRILSLKRLVVEKLPFAALAFVAALLEWRARDVAGLQDVGIGARLTAAAAAPFLYAFRFIWPVRLSPLDVLPISPTVHWLTLIAGLGGLAVVSAAVWAVRRVSRAPATVWFLYVTLLAPIAGLIPSGLQATADRYLYAPGVLLAIAAATAAARAVRSNRRVAVAAVAAVALLAALGTLTYRQAGYWHDSIALWSRAAALDPRNDVALYNLAVALAAEGRDEEAMQRYEQTLALVPDHDLARRQLGVLKDRSLRAQRARGLELVQQGRFTEAANELRGAMDAGARDASTSNALAYALVQTNHAADAATILSRAAAAHPDDLNVKHNLARLLTTTEDPTVRDPARALQIAREVCDGTGNRDPRALDTLALAYAANGQRAAARETAARAIGLARERGDEETAAAIAAHLAGFGR